MRIRTIKPEFWRNRKLAGLGREVHDFAARLITASDDHGYAAADPALLAGDLYPFDTDAQRFIRKSLPELERIGFIEIRGGEFGILRLPKFREHQRINRPSESRLQPRFEQLPGIAQFSEDSVSAHGGLSEDSPTEVEVEVEVEQGKGSGTGITAAQELAACWNSTTTPPLARVDVERLGKVRSTQLDEALKRRPLTEWCTVFKMINASPYCRGAKGWKADIDWATRPEGKKPEPAMKVLEGAFADVATGPPEADVHAQRSATHKHAVGDLT